MQSKKTGALIALAGLAVAGALFFVLNDGDESGGDPVALLTTTQTDGAPDDKSVKDGSASKPPKPTKPPEPTVLTVKFRNGAPIGGVAELSFTAGDTIRFAVASDVADEVHVHGYDVSKPVPAGGKVRLSFPATIEGRYEVELENLGVPVAEIDVRPG